MAPEISIIRITPMQSVQKRSKLMKRWTLAIQSIALGVTFGFLASLQNSHGQIVQIPSVGTFSISTSVAAPDSGRAYMGGNRGVATSNSRGAVGQSNSASGAGVSATMIDLDELDRMIRSQASKASVEPSLKQFDPAGYSRIPARARGRVAPPEYDYLATLSGDSADKPHVSGYGSVLHEKDADATKHYLNLANLARQRGHWASVETYYRLAWQSLPQSRREVALRSLEKSRAKATGDRVMYKGQVPHSKSSSSR